MADEIACPKCGKGHTISTALLMNATVRCHSCGTPLPKPKPPAYQPSHSTLLYALIGVGIVVVLLLIVVIVLLLK